MNISLTDVEAKRFLADRFDVAPHDITLLNSIPVSLKDAFEAIIELNDEINRLYNHAGLDADRIRLILCLRGVLRLDLVNAKNLAEMIIEDSKKI